MKKLILILCLASSSLVGQITSFGEATLFIIDGTAGIVQSYSDSGNIIIGQNKYTVYGKTMVWDIDYNEPHLLYSVVILLKIYEKDFREKGLDTPENRKVLISKISKAAQRGNNCY